MSEFGFLIRAIEQFGHHIGVDGLIGIFGGYLLGSIPFGLVLCSLAGLGDIRQIGSGNIGATNVLRTGRKGLALLTLILDGGKGAAAVLIAWLFGPAFAFGAALGAVLGHNFPLWLKFKGGKGVATTLGVLLALNWPTGLAACLVWLLTAFISRISSLSAIMAMVFAPMACLLVGAPNQVYLIGLIAVIVIARHHANIARLIKGEEPKIGHNN